MNQYSPLIPPRPRRVVDPWADIRRAFRQATEAAAFNPAPKRTPKRGDVVRMTATLYYVSKVNDDGTLVLAETADPFAETADPFADPVTLDRVHTSRLTVTKEAPPEPMVGDTITGSVLANTPWRRGTVIRYDGNAASAETAARYVLTARGDWFAVNTGDRVKFCEFVGGARFVVEHAPGKATRKAGL